MFNIPSHKGNILQNFAKWLSTRKQATNTGEDAEIRNPHTLLVGM
jgi:hypothetical protein